MSKIITDENKNELDTSQEEKVTENYALEILGLKDIADFRKFSRSFMKLDKIIKDLENNTTTEFNKKLNKGENLETEYDTAVKIVTELKKKQNKEDSTLKTVVKTIVGAINELFTNKLEKGGYSGNAKNLNDEISKKASKTVLGRMIVGDNLTVDSSGRVSGNPQYTHPTGNGNTHIPANGTTGQFLKWLSAGVAQWVSITWSDITGRPSSFPPSSHTHDDRYYTEAEINNKLNGKANSSHSHTKSEITDFPASLKNPNGLTISFNGTSQGIYDGSSAKNINITAGAVGAYTKNEVDNKLNNKANSSGTYSGLNVGNATYSSMINGTYTGNGGNQNPSYIPSGKVRFNMMKTTINGNSDYKDWLLMDTYNGNDVPVVTGFGISKNSTLRAFIMQGAKGGSSWDRTAELYHTGNFNPSSKLEKGGLPAKIPDAKGLYDLIESNSGLNFDTALLYLNDAGTKYVNKIYFDRNKKGLFKCISQTTSTTNSTSYFVDISNEANSAQLRNLGTLKAQYENSSGTSSLITLKENMDNYTDIIFIFTYNGGVKMTHQMPVSQFKLYSFGYDMRGGENANRNYGAQILYKNNTSVQATGRITIFKVILKK